MNRADPATVEESPVLAHESLAQQLPTLVVPGELYRDLRAVAVVPEADRGHLVVRHLEVIAQIPGARQEPLGFLGGQVSRDVLIAAPAQTVVVLMADPNQGTSTLLTWCDASDGHGTRRAQKHPLQRAGEPGGDA